MSAQFLNKAFRLNQPATPPHEPVAITISEDIRRKTIFIYLQTIIPNQYFHLVAISRKLSTGCQAAMNQAEVAGSEF